MHIIRGLLVDDEKKNHRRSIDRLNTQFKRFGWEVRWDTCTEPEEGRRRIGTAAPPYDVVLIDLLYAREDFPDLMEQVGLELIAEARRHSHRTYVIGISSGERTMPDLFGQALEHGAHRVVRRYEFTHQSLESSPATIVRAVREHLLNNGTVRTMDIEADQHDPAVQSLVERITEPTLSQLYSRVLEAEGVGDVDTMQLSYLASGASGAVVCSVAAASRGGPMQRHVLKVSRDEQSLTSEAQRNAAALKVFPPTLLVRQRPERAVGPVNGWYALGATLTDQATTLRAWLAAGPPGSDIEDVMHRLFVEGLGAAHIANREDGPPLVEQLRFSHLRRRLVAGALEEFGPALLRTDGGGLSDIVELTRELRSFTEEGRPLGVPLDRLRRPTGTTYAHGDLHGGNVLVCQHRYPMPVLIDTGAFGRLNWSADAARFAVDLVMRSVDTGVESMFFTRFAFWRELSLCLGRRTAPPVPGSPTAGTRAALTALAWLVTNLSTICPDAEAADRAWEWQVALAEYFLRAACHPDLPPPKRASALVAAHDQLREATGLLLR
ncbi:hypothetical protein ACFFS2_16035 [Streptomyces aurantiacus]|uniref:Uncharacterized protein n=1 Tax=Streptomyces aurantiacus TaxID=47760 RepID=A0A7G1NWQ9_9ACTN|nr:hypothetical protein [Streptomyces aurantiacus]BCL26064.1 hypothetical protein GCM10017557_09230 [Streptomyces aurantiacus]